MNSYLRNLGLALILFLPVMGANAQDDIGYQLDDSGYIIDGQETNKTHFDSDFDQFAHNPRRASGSTTFVFSPRQLRWYAYAADGSLIGSGRASGGKGYCPDVRRSCRTPVGSYRIYSMGNAGCKSTKFPIPRGGAPMPYCMFFRGGYAIHGSYDVPNYNASHGCIRVQPSAARWLRYNVLGVGSRVIVKSY